MTFNGYLTADVVRKNAGSPGTWFIFSGTQYQSFMFDNLGSNIVYINWTSGLAGVGSTNLLLPPAQQRSFDFRTNGSINILTSGGAVNTDVQVVGLRD